jgi:hypothetical protein
MMDTDKENEMSHIENNEVVIENEMSDVEDNEVVVIGTIPCPTNPSGEINDKKGKTSGKQPIVYQRMRFKN